ncbi:hypothetical protein [Amycolatopsis keratiniphila]|uniref:hypothetical protein n=1 Tax=Amycolatopsis keratiniphila TaxID=129921 RepID=UPI00087D1C95|nr:hypothetical protein [Amycolatopsis keratiniphila]OLZ59496.1 hypothetical protein BS330_03605 [Amycolatopsis keratiniphila subsp. nogabecina]SDU53425.1 hypothetical protein SAMN04489733_5627 [Amycolatopsis keratiniphila]
MTHAHALPDPHDLDAWRAWSNGQLAPLDLTVDLLYRVVENSQRKKDAASPVAPLQTPGQDGWSEAVISFREQTGWGFDEEDGLSRTWHPSRTFFVVVRPGSDSTGLFDPSRTPSPKTRIRTVLRDLIDEVPYTAPLFDVTGDGQSTLSSGERPQLWLFLFSYRDGLLYAELSRPAERIEDKITRYHQRIPLPPLPYTRTGTSVIVTPDDDLDTGPDIDVQPI